MNGVPVLITREGRMMKRPPSVVEAEIVYEQEVGNGHPILGWAREVSAEPPSPPDASRGAAPSRKNDQQLVPAQQLSPSQVRELGNIARAVVQQDRNMDRWVRENVHHQGHTGVPLSQTHVTALEQREIDDRAISAEVQRFNQYAHANVAGGPSRRPKQRRQQDGIGRHFSRALIHEGHAGRGGSHVSRALLYQRHRTRYAHMTAIIYGRALPRFRMSWLSSNAVASTTSGSTQASMRLLREMRSRAAHAREAATLIMNGISAHPHMTMAMSLASEQSTSDRVPSTASNEQEVERALEVRCAQPYVEQSQEFQNSVPVPPSPTYGQLIQHEGEADDNEFVSPLWAHYLDQREGAWRGPVPLTSNEARQAWLFTNAHYRDTMGTVLISVWHEYFLVAEDIDWSYSGQSSMHEEHDNDAPEAAAEAAGASTSQQPMAPSKLESTVPAR